MKAEPISPKTQSFLSDESHIEGFADGIVFPATTEELADVVKEATENDIRLTVQGARTGLVGGAVPQGGWIVSLSKMNAVPEFIEAEGRTFLRVQAGVTLEQVEAAAASRGLFFAPNPTEQTATIGGMFATGASGMSGLCFGLSSQFVQRLRWVTPQGDIWDIRRGEYCFDEAGCIMPNEQRLSLSGHIGEDLIDFLSGSEGRLGIATELDLLLIPLHKECWGVVYFFTDVKSAMEFAKRLTVWRRANPDLLFAAEYLNSDALALLGSSRSTAQQSLPDFSQDTQAALYVELRGDDDAALEQALEEHLALFTDAGGDDAHTWAENGPGIRRLRDMRHTLVETLSALPGKGAMKWELDFAAPPERFAETLRTCEHELEKHGLSGIIYGHLLQNRMHVALSPQAVEEREAAEQALSALAARIVREGGRLAAEYGRGKISRPWMDGLTENDEAAQQAVKAFFDPLGRMRA